MDGRGFGPAILDSDKHVHVRGIDPRVFDEDVKIAVLVENPGVQQFVFGLVFSPGAVGMNKLRVGKFPLRIFVEHFQVGMCGRGVQVVIELLAILAVIALAVGQTEKTLLENRIASVPESKREAKSLVVIGESGDAILAPSIGAAAGMVVREVLPGIAVLRCSLRALSPIGVR